MGIIIMPPKKYQCSKCGNTDACEAQEPVPGKQGHDKVVRCPGCGHEWRMYVPSLMEQLTGSGTVSYSTSDYESF